MTVDMWHAWGVNLTPDERSRRLRAERCETCGAMPPMLCVTKTRRTASLPHAERMEAALETYRQELSAGTDTHRS